MMVDICCCLRLKSKHVTELYQKRGFNSSTEVIGTLIPIMLLSTTFGKIYCCLQPNSKQISELFQKLSFKGYTGVIGTLILNMILSRICSKYLLLFTNKTILRAEGPSTNIK